MSDFLTFVGARIKQLRMEKGFSQAQLAELAELQDSYIGGVERGKRNISLKSLEKIMLALEADPAEAFKFGELDEIPDRKGKLEKKDVLDLHISLLRDRSLPEVKLVQRMVRDMFDTYDRKPGDKV
ncbi:MULTISPECIES: helix-turn-helix domain-containing protein [Paenibacillus]|uniref:DNA-binding XRE family transcriptional regulator n=1 Tax=Paenibacillus pabuli TaxID=1472 RepID=A0A855Y466_9BACL|nr:MULTISPECIES: helix-turn-helix transcriptional regulator [Paenibacillus]PWW37882.1 DNA-binding XRE family transcriptional regulator [Paenibacillus pabuli]PXW08109.1 DNA-binding XRE family transcriptional regulator [Paenibacillus taichungensis]